MVPENFGKNGFDFITVRPLTNLILRGELPPIHMPFFLEAANLSRIRSPVTSRSNCANDKSTLSICVFAIPASARAADLSGTWTITSKLWAEPHTCVLKQVANDLSGTCKGPQADGPAFGIVNGQEIRWAWQGIRFADQKRNAWDFVGRLNQDGTISGTLIWGNQTEDFAASKLRGG